HPLTSAMGAAGPAGVDQPARCLVGRNKIAEHLAIDTGVAWNEWCAEARRECRLRLAHSAFRPRDLGGIARQEMVHRLGWGQPGDRRQYAEGIGGEHDDALGGWREAAFAR